MGGIADVHVTATANGFFLAWSNRTNGIGVVEGTYVDVVGDVVSALPVFSIDTTSTVLLSSVATNGSSELATSYSYNQPAVHTHEITRNGSVVTVGARTLVARGFLAAGLSTTPSAVWTGTHYQMVWADARASDDKSVLFGIRVDGHGVPIDVIGRPLTTVEGYDFVPSLAWDGQKAFATFRMNPVRYGQTQVMAIHVEADGSPTEATPVLVAGLAPGFASFPPATVWMNDDATFLFVDSKTTQTSPGAYDNALLTTWLDRSGRRLDTTAQRVNPEVSHDLYPALAAGPPGEALLVHAKSGATFDAYAGFLALRLVTSGSPIGAACSAHEDCRLRNCVDGYCCNEACGDACRTCSATPGTCTAVTSGTDPPTCSGTSSCGPTGTCKANDGRACSEDAECLSGHCADGVCCDTACQGSCDACDLAGSVGVCSVVPAGRPGTPDCFPATCDGTRPNCPGNCTTDADCAADGFCSKNGLCEIRRSNGQTCNDNACQIPGCRQCTSGHCVDGYCCDGACSGACDSCSKVPGTCQRASRGERGNPSCSPFVCTGTSDACPTRCTDSTECVNGARCDVATRTCVARLRVGSACDAPDVCESGACVDGVCCDRACNGQCEACDATGSVGNCSPISGDPHGNRPSCGGGGGGVCARATCDGTKSASSCSAYPGPEVECAPAACSAGTMTFAIACDGQGRCGDGAVRKKACAPYECDGTVCRTSCRSDADCRGGSACDVASGKCVSTSTCEGTLVVAATGERTDCFPNVCADGACGTQCASIDQCASGAFCDERGKCQPNVLPPPRTNSGCGCRVVPTPSPHPAWSVPGLVLVSILGRRRARRRPSP
ncbi:MAG: MYXO-CTERM sorting domain-containing protein [Polyangiaceae bacterium]